MFKYIRHLSCMALLLPMSAAQAQTVSNDDASRIVKALTDQLTDQYPFPEISAQYKAALLKNEAAGQYFQLSEAALGNKLTADLQATHKDVHLHVWRDTDRYKALVAPHEHHRGNAADFDAELEADRRGGYGYQRVELDAATSTAYINIPGGFKSSQEAFEMAASAMGMAAYSQHIVIDLRHNGGGSGQMGRFLASYFYEPGNEQFYLNGFYKDRSKDIQEWTYPFVPGHHMPHAKLYVLVDHNTASASEGFAYAIQQLHRGTIVGDTTAGAGIAGGFHALGNNLIVFLPVKMVTAPNSTVGWEGTGVIPDVTSTGPAAWDAAKRLILKDIMADTTDHVGQAAAQWRLEDDSSTSLEGDVLKKKYAALVGTYNKGEVTITAVKEGLQWNRFENGKAPQHYALREVKPDVITILEMNKEYGGPTCSRIYLQRDAAGHIESLIRKTIMTAGTIYTSPSPYLRSGGIAK
ncbi:hypothetical protein DCM91_15665 [Chitinophaga costaii]|nr:S41 family peptidase [Chitinophaga costaii]PUZ22153.1 hypothetical protein DCM91_15665 [Chitinophaga costaii]